MGHSTWIASVAFSPDGKYALSGSDDKTLKLWDIATGKEIRTFTGHTERVNSVAFSPDSKYALSGSKDGTTRLWDISTGWDIRTLKGDGYSVAFSPDGKLALSSGSDLKLWDLASGKEIKEFSSKGGNSVAFSPDGKYALCNSRYGRLELLELASGKEIRKFEGHTGEVNSVAFSQDGKYMLSGSADNTLKLWDVATGKEIKTFNAGYGYGGVDSAALSPDGKYALSGSSGDAPKLWDIATGKEIRTFGRQGKAVSFSPDGRYAFIGYEDKTLKLWDVETGQEIRSFKGHVNQVYFTTLSFDGRYALLGDGLLWDVATGRKIRKFETYGAFKSISPDGRFALSIDHATVKLWDVATGNEIRTFNTNHKYGIDSITISPDGKYILSAGYGIQGESDPANPPFALKLWEVATGKEIRTFTGHKSGVKSVALSPDGRYVLSGDESGKLKLWDVSTGKEIRTVKHDEYDVTSVSFSPDGRYAISGGLSSTKLWDVATGREIRKFTVNGWVWSVAFPPDGKQVLTGGDDHTIRVWDVDTAREIRTFAGHRGAVKSVFFFANGINAFSSSYDNTARIWDISTGKEIAQFISFTDGEWIVITPEGYYNSSANGDKHLNVRIGNNVYGIDQYRSTFYKPQIVEAALKLGDTQKAVTDVVGEQKVALPTVTTIQNIEPPFIVIKSPEDGKKVGSINTDISLYVEDRNQTIKKVTIYINGRIAASGESRGVKITPKAGAIGIPEGKKTMDLKIPVTLETGENLIEVMAFNGFSEGRKSVRIYLEEKVASKKGETILPNLWILSIGINKYQDKKLTPLSYAVADADGIVNAFKGQKGKLFREINSLIISDSSSIKPTFDNIIDNLSYVKKAGANDVVLLFIAGHGINDDSGEFYFLPSDAVISENGSIKKSKAISWREIKAILDIPAKKLIFADTCHSEGVSGKKTRGVDNDRFVKELQEANAVIFTSSRGRELSQESDKWKHGAFTYALIEGINGKADLIKDKKISMKELDAYVSETVPQITNGAQHPITNTPDGYVNFPVAVVE